MRDENLVRKTTIYAKTAFDKAFPHDLNCGRPFNQALFPDGLL
jgi:hypothetical protein